MEFIIRALHVSEAVEASQLLARAFALDPIITHYLDDPNRRAIAFPAFFEGILEEILPSGTVFAAKSEETMVGVAAWVPPAPQEPDESARSRAANCHRTVRAMFPTTSAHLFDGFAALESRHPHEPHWYLAFVGIEPRAQGEGIGGQLLAPVLAVADETKTTCYLETPFPRTHAFYERLGFEKYSEMDVFAGAPQSVVTFIRRR
ncbi:MAG: GNAT family N-acetyltransferase [Actinomycetota bacterium]